MPGFRKKAIVFVHHQLHKGRLSQVLRVAEDEGNETGNDDATLLQLNGVFELRILHF